jgi:hypothetical protein
MPIRSGRKRSLADTTETGIGKVVWALLCLVPLLAIAQMPGMGLIDPWWNFALGRLMLEQHQLVVADPFSFTPGVTGVINQQWLAQLAWATAYEQAGQLGAFMLRDAAIGITAACLWLIGRDFGASRRALVAASLLSACLMASNLGVRAQTLAFPLAALSLLLLQRGGWLMWLVVLLAVIWANVHGSFPLIVAFTGAFTLGNFLTGARRKAFTYGGLTLAAALGTLVTPYGPEVWRYAIDLSSNDAMRSALTEWAPTTIQSLTGKAFFIEVVAAGAIVALRRPQLPITWLLLAGGLSLFGLSAVRNVVWVGLIGLPLWATLLDRTFDTFVDHATRPRTVLLIAAALVAVALLPALPVRVQLPSQLESDVATGDQEHALADLTDYLSAEPHARLFHDADWGAYLEAHLGPEQQVFIDTRFEVHPTTVWDDYLAVSSGRYDWERILDRYAVERVAIDPDRTPILAQALDASGTWRQVWRTDRNAERIVVWDRQVET